MTDKTKPFSFGDPPEKEEAILIHRYRCLFYVIPYMRRVGRPVSVLEVHKFTFKTGDNKKKTKRAINYGIEQGWLKEVGKRYYIADEYL